MNLKLMNTKTAILVLAFMMADTGSALAGTVLLTGVTGNSCSSYTGYSADASGNLTVTCADTGPAPDPTEAPSCTLTASPASINAGSYSILSANCSPAATSFEWTGTGSGGQVSPTSTTTYSVTGTNSFGKGNTATVTVSVSQQQSNSPGSRSTPPTSQSPLSDIRAWNYAFETINYIPHNAKVEPIGTLAYYKRIQADKPIQFHLPNPW